DPASGAFMGQLKDTHGNPLVLNGGFKETDTKGLWGIGFGNGAHGAGTSTLFFAAGINAEGDGLFGSVQVADNDNGSRLAAHHGHDMQSTVKPAAPIRNARGGATAAAASGTSTTFHMVAQFNASFVASVALADNDIWAVGDSTASGNEQPFAA